MKQDLNSKIISEISITPEISYAEDGAYADVFLQKKGLKF
jgi:hypothetical protein